MAFSWVFWLDRKPVAQPGQQVVVQLFLREIDAIGDEHCLDCQFDRTVRVRPNRVIVAVPGPERMPQVRAHTCKFSCTLGQLLS